MLEYLIVNGVLSAGAIVAAIVVTRKRKVTLCDTCKYLRFKTEHPRRLEYKYECEHDRMWVRRNFDTPPAYCKYYEPRKKENNV